MTSKTVTVNIGSRSISGDTLEFDVTNWENEKIVELLRETALEIMLSQARLDNLPSSVEVDNSSFKTIEEARYKVVVLFGTRLVHAVITAIRQALRETVDFTTKERTGNLRNIDAWEWTLVPAEGQARVVDPYSIPMLSIHDRLILRPKVFYATSVNSRVSSGDRAINLKVGGRDKDLSERAAAARLKRIRNNSNKGFFGAAATIMRRNRHINTSFSVYAAFTSKFALPGEVWKAGKGTPLTAQIVLRPKRRGKA